VFALNSASATAAGLRAFDACGCAVAVGMLARAMTKAKQTGRWLAAVRDVPALALVPAVFAAAVLLGDHVHHGPVLCVFRLTTGLPCAGCGMTRAFVALARGDLQQALAFNWLAPAVFAWFAVWWLWAMTALVRARPLPEQPVWLLRGALAAVIAYWAGRVGWFLAAPEPWRHMVENSPLLLWIVGPG